MDAAVLASEFDSLPTDYQNVIRLVQQQHGIRVIPLQELKGGFTGAVLFLVSVSTSGSRIVEHPVLKLDRPWPGEPDEFQSRLRSFWENLTQQIQTDNGSDAVFRLAESRRREFRTRRLFEFDLGLPVALGIAANSAPLEMLPTAEVRAR